MSFYVIGMWVCGGMCVGCVDGYWGGGNKRSDDVQVKVKQKVGDSEFL